MSTKSPVWENWNWSEDRRIKWNPDQYDKKGDIDYLRLSIGPYEDFQLPNQEGGIDLISSREKYNIEKQTRFAKWKLYREEARVTKELELQKENFNELIEKHKEEFELTKKDTVSKNKYTEEVIGLNFKKMADDYMYARSNLIASQTISGVSGSLEPGQYKVGKEYARNVEEQEIIKGYHVKKTELALEAVSAGEKHLKEQEVLYGKKEKLGQRELEEKMHETLSYIQIQKNKAYSDLDEARRRQEEAENASSWRKVLSFVGIGVGALLGGVGAFIGGLSVAAGATAGAIAGVGNFFSTMSEGKDEGLFKLSSTFLSDIVLDKSYGKDKYGSLWSSYSFGNAVEMKKKQNAQTYDAYSDLLLAKKADPRLGASKPILKDIYGGF